MLQRLQIAAQAKHRADPVAHIHRTTINAVPTAWLYQIVQTLAGGRIENAEAVGSRFVNEAGLAAPPQPQQTRRTGLLEQLSILGEANHESVGLRRQRRAKHRWRPHGHIAVRPLGCHKQRVPRSDEVAEIPTTPVLPADDLPALRIEQIHGPQRAAGDEALETKQLAARRSIEALTPRFLPFPYVVGNRKTV